MAPRTYGVLMQPAPDGAAANGGDEAEPTGVAGQIRAAPTRQRQLVAGGSQASALISTTSSGGKSPRSTRTGALLESGESLLEEPLAPHTDHFASRVETDGNLVVAEALSGEQDHLGAENLKIRQRILDGSPSELLFFGGGQGDLVRALSGYGMRLSLDHPTRERTIQKSIYVSVLMKMTT